MAVLGRKSRNCGIKTNANSSKDHSANLRKKNTITTSLSEISRATFCLLNKSKTKGGPKTFLTFSTDIVTKNLPDILPSTQEEFIKALKL